MHKWKVLKEKKGISIMLSIFIVLKARQHRHNFWSCRHNWEAKPMNGGEKDFMKDTFCKSDGDNRIFFEIFPSLPHKMWNTQIYRLFILKKKKWQLFLINQTWGSHPCSIKSIYWHQVVVKGTNSIYSKASVKTTVCWQRSL